MKKGKDNSYKISFGKKKSHKSGRKSFNKHNRTERNYRGQGR
jgi:hypothetical protein